MESQPKLTPEASDVAMAFKLLTKMRPANGFGGLSPILLSDIREYVSLFGLPWIGLEMFVYLLVATDEEFRKAIASKADEPKKIELPGSKNFSNLKEVSGRRDVTD